VVAEFFEVHHERYRDAFRPQARSHRTITTLGGRLLGLVLGPANPLLLTQDLDDAGSLPKSNRWIRWIYNTGSGPILPLF
jgi:hypothetical protein